MRIKNKNINTPKGTRDLDYDAISKRNFIIDKIKNNFIKFGFVNIETPAIENIEFMKGNYGDEGDKLMYKIRSNKSLRDNMSIEDIEKIDQVYKDWLPDKSKLVLRYDLTMPLARYIAQNINDIAFPFKRFQIQNVFRADRPQKGRWREFVQCDADIVGSSSKWTDIELIQIYDKCFGDLGLDNVILRINNRKILEGINDMISTQDSFDIITLLDKTDKLGLDYVIDQINENAKDSHKIVEFIKNQHNKSNISKLNELKTLFKDSSKIEQGIKELMDVIDLLDKVNIENIDVNFDITLARGLDYYTANVFEIFCKDINIGSIGGGGRYDNLLDRFGVGNMPCIGISFGIDRIYKCMEDKNLFDEEKLTLNKAKLMLINFGDDEILEAMPIIDKIRNNGINLLVFPNKSKFDTQIKYALKNSIRYILILGSKEIKSKTISIKDLSKSTQENVNIDDFIDFWRKICFLNKKLL